MDENVLILPSHQNGESTKNNLPLIEPLICDTFKGPVHVEWDNEAPVTPMGQLIFFVQFLKTCGLFANWVEDCPLDYKSPHASKKVDILGTLFLSVLAGQTHYAHITGIRNDTVNPPLLGMSKILSEDAARKAFKYANFEKCKEWQKKHLKICYEPLLDEPWILDVDTTIKVLYGKQEGAERGYNPEKPGRPAHMIHSYMMAETRIILDCEVLPGKQNAASYSLPRLFEIIDSLPKNQKPSLVRGDCAFGNETVLGGLEQREVNYLVKLRHTKKVKELISYVEGENAQWVDAGQKWEGIESSIQLMGWSQKRRVIILRRAIKGKRKRGRKPVMQMVLFSFGTDDIIGYEYSILVTNLKGEVISLAQLYRDRATCENNFDELKNQWGWAGFVTQDLQRSQIMARIIAQTYNWWSLFVRWIDPDKHKEAITSRPLLLYGVARESAHAGQSTLKVTPTHGKSEQNREKIELIIKFLRRIKYYAERFTLKEIWRRILSAIFVKFLKGRILGQAIVDSMISEVKIKGIDSC
jgi:hypothetical protein